MNFDNIEIKITRSNGNLISAEVAMPVWQKKDISGQFTASLPLLGDVQTWAETEEDLEVAVFELFECFCIASEEYGTGLENELESLGWEKLKSKHKHSSFAIKGTGIPYLKGVIDTGSKKVLSYHPVSSGILSNSPSSKPLAFA